MVLVVTRKEIKLRKCEEPNTFMCTYKSLEISIVPLCSACTPLQAKGWGGAGGAVGGAYRVLIFELLSWHFLAMWALANSVLKISHFLFLGSWRDGSVTGSTRSCRDPASQFPEPQGDSQQSNCSFRESDSLFWSPGHQAHTWCTYIDAGTTRMHIG